MRQSCTMLRVPPDIFHVSAQPRRDEPGAGEADCRGEIHEATIVQKDVSAFCQFTICGRHVSQGFFWTSVVCCARRLCIMPSVNANPFYVLCRPLFPHGDSCVCAPLPCPRIGRILMASFLPGDHLLHAPRSSRYLKSPHTKWHLLSVI